MNVETTSPNKAIDNPTVTLSKPMSNPTKYAATNIATIAIRLENAIIKLSNKQFWSEAWVPVKSNIRYDGEEMSGEVVLRLIKFSEMRVPKSVNDRIRLYKLFSQNSYFDIFDSNEAHGSRDEASEASSL